MYTNFFPCDITTREHSQKIGKYALCLLFIFANWDTYTSESKMLGNHLQYEIRVGKFPLKYSKYRLHILSENLVFGEAEKCISYIHYVNIMVKNYSRKLIKKRNVTLWGNSESELTESSILGKLKQRIRNTPPTRK